MTTHTPGQWKVVPIAVDEPGPGEDGTIYEYFIREGLADVAKTYDSEIAEKIVRAVNAYEKIDKVISTIARKNKEDATEYFLRAINCHEELVEVVKTVQRLAFQKGTTELMQRCKQAIAKAEGK